MAIVDKSFKPDAKLAASIEARSNPIPDDQHNGGQPIRQNLDETGHQRSKLVTSCSTEHRNSLECINDNYDRWDICEPFFQAYKKCRKEEHQRKMEENARLSGGNGESCVIS